jgi:hypothetical protein
VECLRRTALLAAIVVSIVALASCTSTAKRSAGLPSTTLRQDVTLPAPAGTTSTVGASQDCFSGSSPATYVAAAGSYAAYLTGIDIAGRTISFDVIQWLVGADAVAAYHKVHPADPKGPPNDYWIVDQSPLLYTAAVSSRVDVRLVRLLQTSNADLKPGTFNELPAYLAAYKPAPGDRRLSPQPFWLTLHDSVVTGLCEQYTP